MTEPADEITREILAGNAVHVAESDRSYIVRRLAETFNTTPEQVQVWIVGSARLGYSISTKRQADGSVLPRFRRYSVTSDIDVAVVSTPIFNAIWSDLARYAYSTATRMPWNSGNLGNYLVHGWLRQDLFPKVRLRRCDQWKDLFWRFSRDPRFNRHRVQGGLFHSLDELIHYQSRAVQEYRQELELEK